MAVRFWFISSFHFFHLITNEIYIFFLLFSAPIEYEKDGSTQKGTFKKFVDDEKCVVDNGTKETGELFIPFTLSCL